MKTEPESFYARTARLSREARKREEPKAEPASPPKHPRTDLVLAQIFHGSEQISTTINRQVGALERELAETARQRDDLAAEFQRVDGINASLWNDLAAVKKQRDELLATCEALVSVGGHRSCSDLHHGPLDQHSGLESCPVEIRWVQAVVKARKAIARCQPAEKGAA